MALGTRRGSFGSGPSAGEPPRPVCGYRVGSVSRPYRDDVSGRSEGHHPGQVVERHSFADRQQQTESSTEGRSYGGRQPTALLRRVNALLDATLAAGRTRNSGTMARFEQDAPGGAGRASDAPRQSGGG